MIYLKLFFVFFKIGLFAFGGGYAMIPLMYDSIQTFDIMTTEEFSNLLAVAQITPGAMGLNAATYFGYATAGIPGAIIASMSVIFPSLIIIFLIAHFYDKYIHNRVIEGILQGIRPVTIGLLATSIIFVGESSLFKASFSLENIMEYGYYYVNLVPVCIFVGVFILNGKFKVNSIILIISSGLLGSLLLK